MHRAHRRSFSATARTADGTGSGWAEDSVVAASREVDAPALAARALQKARDSREPKPLEPGDYTVILEPAAVARSACGFNFAGALSARAADEGRSYFSKKGGGTRVGEKLFHESVTLQERSDRSAPSRPRRGAAAVAVAAAAAADSAAAAATSGSRARPITWIENGVLEEPRPTTATGRRRRAASRRRRPPALILEGGKETMESLIASTERGLLVTQLLVHPRRSTRRRMQLTGLTRDGVWLIEKGKIARPVTNFRFNESPAVLLQNVLGMTPAVRTGNAVVPAIKAANFTFSSLSDAV